MDDILQELDKFDLSRRELLSTEIEQIQVMGFDFLNAVKGGDKDRRDRIFRIFLELAKTKEGLPSLQEYYAGKKIGFFKHTITEDRAIGYVVYIVDNVRGLADFRVKPQSFK